MQHDEIGKKANKPVILEEYGTPFRQNHTATEGPWQATVLKGGLAAYQIWQFGPQGATVDPNSVSDVNTVFYGDAEYQTLGEEHAEEMLEKRP
jgi:mannan endo-1,4-beta-mannosidase